MVVDPNPYSSPRFVIIGFISLVHFASIVNSFEISFPIAGINSGVKTQSRTKLKLTPFTHTKEKFQRKWPSSLQSKATSFVDQHPQDYDPENRLVTSLSFFPRTSSSRANTLKLWLSSQEPEDIDIDAGEEKRKENINAAHDELYEFLTGRTGGAGAERVRKRDQIMEFMGRSSSGEAKNLVQPLRKEDGKVDKELVSQQQQEERELRTKVKFDSLFSGMPTLEEIVSRSPTEKENITKDKTTTKKKTRMTDDDDFSWFEPERERIEREYDQLLQEAKRRIREERLEEEEVERLIQAIAESEDDAEDIDGISEPSSIPDNAENIVESIVSQEMKRMIESVQLERAKQRLQAFESERTSELNARDYQGVTDDVVDNIFKETADQLEQSEILKAGADNYQQYERLRQQEASFKEAQEDQQNVPEDGADLDNWTLDRLNEMLEKSENNEDDDGSITDILEENIEELRKQIERESKKGSIEPQTMKEWQMYQAIGTRLMKDQMRQNLDAGSGLDGFNAIMNGGGDDDDESSGMGNVDEEQVTQQLDSWREYIETEDKLRQKIGLKSGFELPFGDLGTKLDQIEIEAEAEESARRESEKANAGKSRREVRRDVNIQAIEAMEDLIRKSDGRRAEFLKKQLEEIKEGMEENDYYDTEEEEEELVSLDPVDLTGVFTQSTDDIIKEKKEESTFSSEDMDGINKLLSFSGTEPQYTKKAEPPEESIPKPEPPNTPFFSDSFSDSTETQAPVPDTPFFQDTEVITEEEVVDVENKLGSAEEQRLQRMFRKGNVRSYAEQDEIRKKWEEYQEYEKGIRDKSGLSKKTDEDDPSPSLTEGVELQYDPTDVMNEDGDFDAEKVLSTIGPRPTKKKKTPESGSGTPATKPPGVSDNAQSGVDSSDVADAIYRSVSAAGGIGREDKATRDKDRAEYDAYLKKEEELKTGLDELENELDDIDPEVSEFEELDIDDPDYVEEVLDSRPVVNRKRKFDERELSDMGGFLAGSTDADDSEDSDSIDDTEFDDIVPDWLKKEREASGKTEGKNLFRKRDRKTTGRSEGKGIGGAFLGNNEVSDDENYDTESLEEYEKRRAGQRTNMGIDIRDALGRRGPDDNLDYRSSTERKEGGWGAKDFETRKAKLLDYIQLDPSELNSLIALKDSAYATGASQYLPRINKPFKEFGAIFRLEGVLVDITGLQQKAWNRVAAEFGLEEPFLEDVRRAAVLKPEDAVKEVFFTSMGDFILVRRIVDAFRRIFRQEFNAWATTEGFASEIEGPNADNTSRTNSFAIGFEEKVDEIVEQEIQTRSPSDEGSRLRYLQEAWAKTANQFGLAPPTNEQIAESSIVTPDIAVSNIFGWSQEQKQINKIVSAYSMLQAGGNISFDEEKSISASPSVPTNRPLSREEITDEMILELQFMAWGDVAEENSLDVPNPEEILAASSINNPEITILDGFGWTSDPTLAAELASSYVDYLSEYINKYIHNRDYTPVPRESKVGATEPTMGRDDPAFQMATEEEKAILSRQTDAWTETAAAFDFDTPTIEQILSVAHMTPEDAVIKILLTNFNIEECDVEQEDEFYELLPDIIETYEFALKKSSAGSNAVATGAAIVEDGNNASIIPTEDEILEQKFTAWKETAEEYGFNAPSAEQIRSTTNMPIEDIVHKLILMNNDIDNCASDQVEEFYEVLPDIIEAYELALEQSATSYSFNPEGAAESSTDSSREVSQDEIYCASFDSWTSVAWTLGFRLPTQEDVQFAMTVGPKEAIMGGFGWTNSDEEAAKIVEQYLIQIKARRDEWVKKGYTTTIEFDNNDIEQDELLPVEAMPDVLDWIRSLKKVEMGLGVVTNLERDQMKILLDYAGLSDLFPEGNRVSYSNGYLLDSQQLLGTSLRIERRPDHCVVFDSSPAASAAAHEHDMRSVALIGAFPRYELLDADTSPLSVTELTATNIRRLFGERIYDKPMLDTEGENPLEAGKQVKIKTQFEGDE